MRPRLHAAAALPFPHAAGPALLQDLACAERWERQFYLDYLLSVFADGILWYWTQTHGAFEVPLLLPGMPGRDKALGPSIALPRALPF